MSISTRASLLAAVALAGIGHIRTSFAEPTVGFTRNPYAGAGYGSRSTGRHNPAGSKLAKRVRKGTVGIARIR
jgi:hypothetical protein